MLKHITETVFTLEQLLALWRSGAIDSWMFEGECLHVVLDADSRPEYMQLFDSPRMFLNELLFPSAPMPWPQEGTIAWPSDGRFMAIRHSDGLALYHLLERSP